MRLLIAAADLPSPGGKGYQVRLYHQITQLAAKHDIFLIAFNSGGAELDTEIARACRKTRLFGWSPSRAAAAALARAPHLPLSVGLFQDRDVWAAIGESVRTEALDAVEIQLIRMAPYRAAATRVPVVLDLMDAAGLSMSERARSAPPGARQFFELEARRLTRFESHAITEADLSLLISRRDQAHLGYPPRSRVNPNGVDPRPRSNGVERDARTMVFTGTMSYFPNADAACWFATAILPEVRKEIPDALFRIVGRHPGRAVRALARISGVAVTGAVESVGDELARATVAVCPIRYGSGVQTKMLEAMAAGTPVIGTSKAVDGLPERLGSYARVADAPEDFAHAVIAALKRPDEAFEGAARALEEIRRAFTWRHSIEELEDCYTEAIHLFRERRDHT